MAYLEWVRQSLFDRKREDVYRPTLKLRNRRESRLEDRIEIPLQDRRADSMDLN